MTKDEALQCATYAREFVGDGCSFMGGGEAEWGISDGLAQYLREHPDKVSCGCPATRLAVARHGLEKVTDQHIDDAYDDVLNTFYGSGSAAFCSKLTDEPELVGEVFEKYAGSLAF